MRHLVLPSLLFSVCLPSVVLAQSNQPQPRNEQHREAMGTVAGRVLLADGQPAGQVSVRVKGSERGTATDAEGRFTLKAPAGWQVIAVSCLGCVGQEMAVEVRAAQTAEVPPFVLARGEQQLAEVTVTGTKSLNQRAPSVGKMPIAPLDNPQATLTIERPVLEQQQALRLSDVLANVAGVYVMGATGGTQEEIASRGFAYTSANTFKNGVRYNNGIMPEVSSLERMEVLKGSAAILYGNVAAGGILNLVTKKPQFERGGSVGLRVGSYGFVKPQFDVYGAVGASQQVAFRLNGTWERADSYRAGVRSNRVYVNSSLLFRLSSQTDLVIEGDYLRDNRTPDFGIGTVDYQISDSRSRFLNTAAATNATNQTSATATLTTRLSNSWQLRAVGAFQRYANELKSASRPTANVIRPGRNYGNWLRNLQRTETGENYYLAQLDLTGSFRTGGIGHTLLVGADADQYHTTTLAYATQAFDSVNILSPGRQLGRPKGTASGYDALRYNTRTLGNTRRAGFYAQDLISLSSSVKLLAGLRWSYQETPSDVYTYPAAPAAANGPATVRENRRYDNAFSPRVGLVYQPVKTTALFASYSSSFAPQANTVTDNQGGSLPPSLIDQLEVGIKNDLFRGALSANVTAYHIVNNNQAQVIQQYLGNGLNPSYNVSFPSAQELAGQVTSKGVEVDVQSRPMNGISLIAGYSYNNTAYTRSTLYADGSRLRYNPAHTANLSLYYSFASLFAGNGLLRGLSAGATGYYVGDRLAGRNPRLIYDVKGNPVADINKYLRIPNYVLFDASVGYATERFSLRLKMANLLNELSYNVHDDNSVNPVAPRTFAATLSYKL